MARPYELTRLREFNQAHGAAMKLPGMGDRLVCRDGATILPSWTGETATLIEPSTNELERVQLRKHYWQFRVNEAENTFKAFKNFCLGLSMSSPKWQSYWGQCPTGDDPTLLGVLAGVVSAQREQLAAIENHPLLVQIEDRRKAAEAQHQAAEAMCRRAELERQRQIQAITI